MHKSIAFVSFIAVLAAVSAPLSARAPTKSFTVEADANDRIAKKLKIPVFFAVPESARAPLPQTFETTDKLIDFRHPDAKDSPGGIGLRIIETSRAGMAKRLAQSGLVQTGDILLTFRPEWGGAGAYPNIQMGISHTGIAYIKDGAVHNIDNPMDSVYLGPRFNGDLTSEHYRTLNYLHVIRPRGLTDQQRKNILNWATRLTANAKRVYPSQLKFNQDYNAPKFKNDDYDFVKHFGQIALGQNPPGNIDLYCSEFAWALLAMRDCDPEQASDAFKGSRMPRCVKPVMEPMKATGDYMTWKTPASYTGLADGPLVVINSLKLANAQRTAMIDSVFAENPKGLSKMSVGHRTLAKEMQPKFEPLEKYYTGVTGGVWTGVNARLISFGFRRAIPENYSPTSFLINTMLPSNNKNRTMDYVATIVIK